LVAEGDVGGFGPGEVEPLADDVGLVGGLDGEDLVSVRLLAGVRGAASGALAVLRVGVGVVSGRAAGGDFDLFGVDEFAGRPLLSSGGERGGQEKYSEEIGRESNVAHKSPQRGHSGILKS